MSNPYISVIITAYNRDKFLSDAISSVLKQTLDKRFYEIIIIKNFVTKYDKILIKNGIRLMKENGSIGKFFTVGILNAKGDILCFLDDDDKFSYNKLEEVYKRFVLYNNLSIYHNSFYTINESGKEFKPSKFSDSIKYMDKIKSLYIKDEIKNTDIKDFYKSKGGHSMSCISCNKYFLKDNIDYIKKIQGWQDMFLMLLAISKNKQILMDNAKLTSYRLHKKNTSDNTKNSLTPRDIYKALRTYNFLKKNLSYDAERILYSSLSYYLIPISLSNYKKSKSLSIFIQIIKLYLKGDLIITNKFEFTKNIIFYLACLINKKFMIFVFKIVHKVSQGT